MLFLDSTIPPHPYYATPASQQSTMSSPAGQENPGSAAAAHPLNISPALERGSASSEPPTTGVSHRPTVEYAISESSDEDREGSAAELKEEDEMEMAIPPRRHTHPSRHCDPVTGSGVEVVSDPKWWGGSDSERLMRRTALPQGDVLRSASGRRREADRAMVSWLDDAVAGQVLRSDHGGLPVAPPAHGPPSQTSPLTAAPVQLDGLTAKGPGTVLLQQVTAEFPAAVAALSPTLHRTATQLYAGVPRRSSTSSADGVQPLPRAPTSGRGAAASHPGGVYRVPTPLSGSQRSPREGPPPAPLQGSAATHAAGPVVVSPIPLHLVYQQHHRSSSGSHPYATPLLPSSPPAEEKDRDTVSATAGLDAWLPMGTPHRLRSPAPPPPLPLSGRHPYNTSAGSLDISIRIDSPRAASTGRLTGCRPPPSPARCPSPLVQGVRSPSQTAPPHPQPPSATAERSGFLPPSATSSPCSSVDGGRGRSPRPEFLRDTVWVSVPPDSRLSYAPAHLEQHRRATPRRRSEMEDDDIFHVKPPTPTTAGRSSARSDTSSQAGEWRRTPPEPSSSPGPPLPGALLGSSASSSFSNHRSGSTKALPTLLADTRPPPASAAQRSVTSAPVRHAGGLLGSTVTSQDEKCSLGTKTGHTGNAEMEEFLLSSSSSSSCASLASAFSGAGRGVNAEHEADDGATASAGAVPARGTKAAVEVHPSTEEEGVEVSVSSKLTESVLRESDGAQTATTTRSSASLSTELPMAALQEAVERARRRHAGESDKEPGC